MEADGGAVDGDEGESWKRRAGDSPVFRVCFYGAGLFCAVVYHTYPT
jgi:hypothetical protein